MKTLQALPEGSRILVVGARSGNVRPDQWAHEAIRFVTPERAARMSLSSMEAFQAILMTRFVKHKQILRVTEAAQANGQLLYPISTHTLRNSIDQLLGRPMQPKSKPSPPKPAPPKIAPDTIEMFLDTTFDPKANALSEQSRLRSLALESQLPWGRVVRALYERRKKLGLPPLRQSRKSRSKPELAPAAAGLLKLVDDALAALQLVRDEIPKLSQDISEKRLKEQLAQFLKDFS